eukprot:GHVL01018760.1.p1 GENE.GHVL01018760.1~~GHVL01018760.1.p1  ORF type:complete len:236 (+),score=31.09 GHVL01018760.1:45-752(+)
MGNIVEVGNTPALLYQDIKDVIDCIILIRGVRDFLDFLKPSGDDGLAALWDYIRLSDETDNCECTCIDCSAAPLAESMMKCTAKMFSDVNLWKRHSSDFEFTFKRVFYILIKLEEPWLRQIEDGYFGQLLKHMSIKPYPNNLILPSGSEVLVIIWVNGTSWVIFECISGLWKRRQYYWKEQDEGCQLSTMTSQMNKEGFFESFGLYFNSRAAVTYNKKNYKTSKERRQYIRPFRK